MNTVQYDRIIVLYKYVVRMYCTCNECSVFCKKRKRFASITHMFKQSEVMTIQTTTVTAVQTFEPSLYRMKILLLRGKLSPSPTHTRQQFGYHNYKHDRRTISPAISALSPVATYHIFNNLSRIPTLSLSRMTNQHKAAHPESTGEGGRNRASLYDSGELGRNDHDVDYSDTDLLRDNPPGGILALGALEPALLASPTSWIDGATTLRQVSPILPQGRSLQETEPCNCHRQGVLFYEK